MPDYVKMIAAVAGFALAYWSYCFAKRKRQEKREKARQAGLNDWVKNRN